MSDLILDRYEVLKPLAQGGMGEVLLARQTGVRGFERVVVVKSLRPDLAGDASFVEQFLDEARVAATLNHPNIVHIFEVGEWNGAFYIVMEYIDGADLSRMWYAAAKRGLGLPFHVTVRIIHDAALGLDHAHNARDVQGRKLSIVHRDVSPQNIMVRRDGVVKVVDFGIAKAMNRVSSTTVGTVKGKLQYMAPEQVRGEPLDGRSDQFSLGIVLWEMCTGKRLFKAESEIATLNKVLSHPIPPPTSIVAGFPPELEKVMMRMLERDRERRFPSCVDVARDLKAYLDRVTKSGRDAGIGAFVEDILGPELDERAQDLSRRTQKPAPQPEPSRPMPVPAPTTTKPEPRAGLFVSTPDGAEIEFPSLDALKRAIGDRKLGQFDLFVEHGKSPVALGADPRFAPLFAASLAPQPSNPTASAPPVVDAPLGPTSAWSPPPQTGAVQHPTPTPITTGTGARLKTSAVIATDLEDDELDMAFRRSIARPLALGLVVAFVVVGGAVLLLDDELRGRVQEALATVTSSSTTAPAASFTEAERALRTDRVSALDATLETLVGDDVDVTAWRARLHVARARIETERARLAAASDDEARTQAAQARADQERVAAYRDATAARARGDARASAHLAMASYHALRGAAGELEGELALAVERAPPDVAKAIAEEGAVLAALLETQRALQAPDDERADALGRAEQSLVDAQRGAGAADTRVAYAKAALLVARAELDRAVAPSAKAAVDALRTPLAGDERLKLLATRLDAIAAQKAPTPTPAPSPSPTPTPSPAAAPPASPDELVRDADRARDRGLTYKAASLYKKALKAKPTHARALVGLGWAYIDLGKNDDAVRVFERALDADASQHEALFGKAEALRYDGEREAAKAAYKAFLARAPGSPDAPIAKNALKSLGE